MDLVLDPLLVLACKADVPILLQPHCALVLRSRTEAFTLQDMHSLMLMLCSDVPLRVTRSAFKAATPLLPSGDL